MNRLPLLLKISVENEDHDFAFWLPLFIIGPLIFLFLLAVFIIILPFALLAIIFTWELEWWRTLFLLIPAFFRLIAHLPGLDVDVGSTDHRVHIAFI